MEGEAAGQLQSKWLILDAKMHWPCVWMLLLTTKYWSYYLLSGGFVVILKLLLIENNNIHDQIYNLTTLALLVRYPCPNVLGWAGGIFYHHAEVLIWTKVFFSYALKSIIRRFLVLDLVLFFFFWKERVSFIHNNHRMVRRLCLLCQTMWEFQVLDDFLLKRL